MQNHGNGICTLMYHKISKEAETKHKNNPYVISTEKFEEQMKILHDKGFNTITLGEMEQYVKGQTQFTERTVLLTFDDGYKETYKYAYPILKKYNLNAAVFLITNKNTLQHSFLNWKQIKNSRDIFEFASHTHNLHFLDSNMNSYLISRPKDIIIKDLKKSMKLLDTKYFAYPYGQYNSETIEILKEVRFSMAFSTIEGYIKPFDDVFQLKRIGIYPETSTEEFREILKI
ncbi:polysaccharide deacetylase family protein [Anaerosalibacter bizertensis]|uniref:Polysaccharide deacetylase family protein n=1 Tax=Anaerosalibacter bizertensis TaxID=932217 RepID=A0A9Q4ADJ4_9FIRM|nr:polysaccharide deacetylase family protein [Anaerosalibacter bizertensis]MBV1819921.1 polysaccharide deacetylase family protein [Bacteroidales bacterium MSK.15.36]MCB5559610.1 polysaccharide deacetylase family protein [Anaerosalibacter bizertensis]MCG4565646.1 polysaccharide deacetylase family protein [Anaerosalibacter bizertensis]MCG4583561.1 polysaccharide deacetylase family protein [Anaerosalibacter bizertensis]MCG4585279.1 polysaccharide deacetylase family protein [Anaerosalibacter bizer